MISEIKFLEAEDIGLFPGQSRHDAVSKLLVLIPLIEPEQPHILTQYFEGSRLIFTR